MISPFSATFRSAFFIIISPPLPRSSHPQFLSLFAPPLAPAEPSPLRRHGFSASFRALLMLPSAVFS